MTSLSVSSAQATDVSSLSMSAGVMALLAECHSAQSAQAKQDIEINSDKLERLRAEVQRAIEEAKEAEADAGFWEGIADFFSGDVAKLAQAVAAAAAIAVSGGAATPFVVAAIACAGAAELGKAAGLDDRICLGLSLASAALGLCAGGAGAGTVSRLGAAATTAGAGAQVVGGGASIAAGEYRADVLRANARSQHTEAQRTQVELMIEQIIDRLQQLERKEGRSGSIGSQIVQDTHHGRDAVLTNFAGEGR